MAPLGPVGQRMRAQREARRRDKEADDRRRHGSDFAALAPCAHCGERHAPGFCSDPAEHDVSCLAGTGRCPRACIVVCVIAVSCPRCNAPAGHVCEGCGTHRERWAAADRLALERSPQIIAAAWGTEGLRRLRWALDYGGDAATALFVAQPEH